MHTGRRNGPVELEASGGAAEVPSPGAAWAGPSSPPGVINGKPGVTQAGIRDLVWLPTS